MWAKGGGDGWVVCVYVESVRDGCRGVALLLFRVIGYAGLGFVR